MDRAELYEQITQHGWEAELFFNARGPIYVITGDFNGFIEMNIPVCLSDDHAPVMGEIYNAVMAFKELEGKGGHA